MGRSPGAEINRYGIDEHPTQARPSGPIGGRSASPGSSAGLGSVAPQSLLPPYRVRHN